MSRFPRPTRKFRTVSALFGIAVMAACTPDPPDNPYDDLPPVIPTEGIAVPPLPEDNFAWLHQQVFAPTCANSGCHDGTFEPDFRTVGSSWNTLVNHPVIANDAGMTFSRRVVPGNVDASFLYERLTVNIPNTSGMMPLEVDEDSDYDERRPEYLDAIAAWIEAGAPDPNGQVAPEDGASLPPQIHAFVAFPPDILSGPFERAEGAGIQPVIVDPIVATVFIAVTDDQLPMTSLDCSWALGVDVADADAAADGGEFGPAPFTFEAPTFTGSTETYGLTAEIDFSGYAPGTELTLQVRAGDGDAESAVPLPDSPEYIQLLYRLRIAP